jgi:long-chain acyl-CoA synthetase
MSWVDLTLEISERTGVEVDEDAIAGVETVRDLLEAVVDARREGAEGGLDLGADPEAHLAPDQARWLDPPGPAGRAAGRVLHALDRALLRLFRVRVEGRERLPPPDEPVVIAPNHMSLLDPFVVAAALPWVRLQHTHWAGWVGIAFTNGLTRAFSRVTRTFPVDPERGMLSALALGAAALQRGDSLVWFPEGQRSEDGTLRPFKPGLGIILESRPATVVPVHVAGTREALPPGSLRPRPGRRIRVRFGEPVTVADLDGEGEGAERRTRLMDALRRRLEALGAAD